MADDEFNKWAARADREYDRQKKFDTDYWALREDKEKRFTLALNTINGLRYDKWTVEILKKVIGFEFRIASEQEPNSEYFLDIRDAKTKLSDLDKERSKSGKEENFNEAKKLIVDAMEGYLRLIAPPLYP